MAKLEEKTHDPPGKNKTFTIFVNGRERTVEKDKLTYQEVVELAFGSVGGSNIIYTVTYKRGHGNKPEGILTEGECVKLKNKMKFDVTATDKS